MGVSVNELRFHKILPFDTNYEKNKSRGFGYIYSGNYDGKIVMQPEEVEDVVLWDNATIMANISNNVKITPDSISAYLAIKDEI